jgi:hypothetical protein
MASGVPIDLSPGGDLILPSGVIYRRSPERAKRGRARALVESGCPVVTEVYPDGVTLFEGDEARGVWEEISPLLISGKPPLVNDLQWIGHVWQSEDGSELLYFEGRH